MPVPKNTRFRYKKLPEKNGIERRQRLAFHKNKVIEIKNEEKRNGWEVRGDSHKRGTRRTL